MGGSIKVKKECMNNCKVANMLTVNKGLAKKQMIRVSTLPSRKIVTLVNLCQDKNIQLSCNDISPYDMAVMDAFYTLYKSGYQTFSLQTVIRVMSGNMDQDITAQKIARLKESVEKLRLILITIDCTDELRARKLIKKEETAKYRSYFLPVSSMEIQSGNQTVVEGYRLLELPALYAYAERIKQMISVPIELLASTEGFLPDTDENIILKRYLLKRIARMKKEKATVYSRRIRYEWYDRKAQREKGMFAELGYREEDFASRSSWLNKRAKVHKVVKQILDAFRQAGYIAGYSETREGNTITGVEILLGETTEK